jgi:rRNA maturation endonuclease Nob1
MGPSGTGFALSLAMIVSSVLLVVARVPVPLRHLAVCTACDDCFDLGAPVCPECGSDQFRPLAELWEERVLNVTGLN